VEEWFLVARYNLSIDSDVQVAYLKIAQGIADSTCEAAPSVMLDLDSSGGLLGIEFLTLEALKRFTPATISAYVEAELVSELEKFINSHHLGTPVA
jgi:uncharacterized protein YuzE